MEEDKPGMIAAVTTARMDAAAKVFWKCMMADGRWSEVSRSDEIRKDIRCRDIDEL